ncbi:intraflagellar transport-like protein [Aureococcus anophagefferens]|uniref:Intraflagellar transport protein 122 homolog n=1 Tax=Aureococcus anophagefferens TaxID=44056 RepID=A0ABR1G315_AURAN
MKPKLLWTDPGLPPRREDNVKATVYAIAFRPDGTQMVVAVSNLVLVYATSDGDLVHRLRGHKDVVYTVDYARDGLRFASGGADKTVIIWNHKGDGILKFTHNESIQIVCYNPTTEQLASCTATDMGMWSKEQKSVTKHKVYSKILCAKWNNDGQYIALGMYNGHVQIREKNGQEYKVIEKTAPVWCMAWSPARDDPCDLLAVGCWNQTVSFYQLSGAQYLKERRVHFYPCSLGYFTGGQYMVIGGSDKRASLCTREAVRLKNICELDEWVWSLAVRPRQPAVAVGSYGGAISMWTVEFDAVYALDGDRFAVREHMTDVVVHHMQAEKRVRIKSRDYVRGIAVSKDRLAIMLPDRVNIYELHKREEAGVDMHYRLRKERIYVSGDCGKLGVTSSHVILARKNKLQLHGFTKPKEREWVLDAEVTCLKVDGGPVGKEGLLVGLADGAVLKIYIDNPFPIDMVKTSGAVRCLDTSGDRERLAVINDDGRLQVFDLRTKDVAFSAEGASSVSFNSQFDDMLCFSKKDVDELYVKTGAHPVQQHNIRGAVIGFVGAKLFVVADQNVSVIDLPQSAALAQHVDAKEFDKAHRIACLGVTAADWRRLANAAAKNLDLATARASYMRVHDLRQIELLNSMEVRQQQASSSAALNSPEKGKDGKGRRDRGGAKDKEAEKKATEALEPLFQAELLAYAGLYQEAAKAYTRAGHVKLAIDLFADLRQWEEAKLFAASSDSIDTRDLVRRQAEWAEEVEDWAAAADMYVSAGDAMRAVKLLGEHQQGNWTEQMAAIARSVTGEDVLRQCARCFLAAGEDALAREVYAKLDDVEALLQLYVRKQQWAEAIKLAEDASAKFSNAHRAKFDQTLYLPYAEWLALHDRFDEALEAYRKSGRPDMAQHMMEQLTCNAVVESRFKDAAYYYWLLASETLHVASGESGDDVAVAKIMPAYSAQLHKADLYYAYNFIESFFLPFTPLQPEVLFQCARFLVNGLGAREAPHGISKVKILFALAKQAKHLGAYKLARFAYDKLQHMKVPDEWQEQLDVDMLTIHSKPVRDNPELLPVCYRCGAANALLNPATNAATLSNKVGDERSRDVCTSCGHPFVRSFLNFEILPLCKPRAPGMRATYYKSAIADVHIAISQSCHRFFHEEDFEFQVLRDGACPFSRVKDVGDFGPC